MTKKTYELPDMDQVTTDLTNHAVQQIMRILERTQTLSDGHESAALIAIMVATAVIGNAAGHLAMATAEHPQLKHANMLRWTDAVFQNIRDQVVKDERSTLSISQYLKSRRAES